MVKCFSWYPEGTSDTHLESKVTEIHHRAHFQLKRFFVVVVLEIIDMSLNHVHVHENEETTENGIHPELAKVSHVTS